MESYWELSEKERAALTSEQVEAYVPVELMREGVPRPVPLVLIDEPPMPEADKEAYQLTIAYSMREVAFPSAEAAAASVDGSCGLIDSTSYGAYPHSVSIHTLKVIEEPSAGVKRVPIYSAARLAEAHEAIEKAAEARAENGRRKKEWKDTTEAEQKAVGGMWTDWHECRAKAAEVQRVLDTRAEYVKLTDGDEDMAESFLAKVYDADAREQAAQWVAA